VLVYDYLTTFDFTLIFFHIFSFRTRLCPAASAAAAAAAGSGSNSVADVIGCPLDRNECSDAHTVYHLRRQPLLVRRHRFDSKCFTSQQLSEPRLVTPLKFDNHVLIFLN